MLVAPDKFKGTLTAIQAARAIAAGWRSQRPDDHLELLPMTDGGDGFGEVVGSLLGATPVTTDTVDASHRPISAQWWWHPASATAIVESAAVIGMARLAAGEFDPFDLDTYGLGPVLRAAGDVGARRCLVGLGGSATNDGGFGVATALGWRFADEGEAGIERWTDLDRLAAMRPPLSPLPIGELIVAVDVRNPLLGPDGCSRVYGPQKGLVDLDGAERRLEQLAMVVGGDLGIRPGAGAAGGLGFGLAAFAGGMLRPGFGVFAELARLTERMERADLVLTGEGSLDAQTFMGKGVGEIAAMARARGVPCVALVGRHSGDHGEYFASVHAIDAGVGADVALGRAAMRVAAAHED